jgi:hypothetical protein
LTIATAVESAPSDTGASEESLPMLLPPPGHEAEFYACMAETKGLESLLRLYELRADRPDLEQEITNHVEQLAHIVRRESTCQGKEAVSSRLLGQELCDLTEAHDVPEEIAAFCGR